MFSSIGSMLLLAFGFGFVIFFHELGHFLAAKWADVKVEQFAVGFGQAMLSWRKGLGYRWGSTQAAFQEKLKAHLEQNHSEELNFNTHNEGPTQEQLDRAAQELGISETEYRLNWIPLGGYVKMLGQDDMKPGVTVNDPRAYNNKSVGQRMVIVSAGVIMNVILAAIGFMTIFLVGFEAPPAIVGNIMTGAPAQHTYKLVNGAKIPTPLRVGDRILYLDDKYQSDFTKISLNVALIKDGRAVPLYVRHPDGSDDHLFIEPAKSSGDAKDFVAIGVMQPYELKAPDADMVPEKDLPQLVSKEALLLNKGDTITAINGQPVAAPEFWKLDQAMQDAKGAPVRLTIMHTDGKSDDVSVKTYFIDRFGTDPLNFAGLLMRTAVHSVQPESPAKGQLLPGDIITDVADPSPSGEHWPNPTRDKLMTVLNQAGQKGLGLDITVLRDGKEVLLKKIVPSLRLSPERYGIGIGLGFDDQHPVLAGTLKNSAASAADIPEGATIIAIDSHAVKTWFDVNTILASAKPGKVVNITARLNDEEKTYAVGPISQEAIDQIAENRFSCDLSLQAASFARKTSNPLIAAGWGVGETRDAILNVYQTVMAMWNGSVSYKQVSGPVGIFAAGYRFASMGITRLIWFLSIIGANLAVMNFLPIPIVDGGLFTFLIIEKLKGSPVSPRVQAIAQVVGLAILFSVFLLATYQDITRLPFMTR